MKRNEIIVGGVLLAVVGFFLIRSQTPDKTPEIEENVPIDSQETENHLEQVLGRTLPDDAEKLTLKGDNGQTAIATRKEDNGVVEFTILADLADSEDGIYQVWAGSSNDTLHSLGTLTAAKGGYLFEYRQTSELSNFNNVVISLEKKVDQDMEDKVMEGSF